MQSLNRTRGDGIIIMAVCPVLFTSDVKDDILIVLYCSLLQVPCTVYASEGQCFQEQTSVDGTHS